MNTKLTRQRFLKALGAGTAWIALVNAPGCKPAERNREGSSSNSASRAQRQYVRAFRSRPDLSPPAVKVTTRARDTAPGYVFVAPKKGDGQYGPMILDDRGQPVWFRPLQRRKDYAFDFKVQQYRGEPVLTWAEGIVVAGHGLDEYIILNSSYREVGRLQAGNGLKGDHHEFLITQQDTALITIYDAVPWDLSPIGGSRDGMVLDGIVQELDIETGEVLFEWHSLDYILPEESYLELPESPRRPFDYFHINSIEVDHDSNLLVSARNTWGVYKIDRESGEVMWRLGGKKSDFEMGPDTRIAYQHDARRQPDGTVTVFDNGDPNEDEQSYGLVLELDEEEMTASLVREYTHPDELLAHTQANVQVLPSDNVFIGWGSTPIFSEFSKDGELLFGATFSDTKNESYRAFRFPWIGRPTDDPALAAERTSDKELTLYASWNGATEVAAWQPLAGPNPDQMKPVGPPAAREGFETAIAVSSGEEYVKVRAEDGTGEVLGTSKAIKPVN